MFKIRKEHLDAFRQEAIRDFEKQALAHVERCFPEPWAALGDVGVGAVVRTGIARAAGYGIKAEGDVCKFIDLMLVFGTEFDERCAWAREVLDAASPGGPHARTEALQSRALEEA